MSSTADERAAMRGKSIINLIKHQNEFPEFRVIIT
jgi:hypothetical protein